MDVGERRYVRRSSVDRRSLVDRRVINLGIGHPIKDLRKNRDDRRRGWEDRYRWERVSKWSSIPTFPFP